MATLPLMVSSICSNGRNCKICRNRFGGSIFRDQVATLFLVPANWPECPYGRPWEYSIDKAPPIAPSNADLQNQVHNPPDASSIVVSSDWKVRGPILWSRLHKSALAGQLTEQYIVDFTATIGCGDCRLHWIAWSRNNPPDLSSAEAQFAWTVQAHNSVNQRINKPQLTVQQALAIWQPSA